MSERTQKVVCPNCLGSGTVFLMKLNSCGHWTCPECKGTGFVRVARKESKNE